MRQNVEGFLLKHGMHYQTINLDESADQFEKQIKNGLAGEPSSLLMLPSYIKIADSAPKGAEVIVIDAGGTNLRIGTARYGEDGLTVTGLQKHPMPGTKGLLGKEEFFEAFADYMEPVLDCSDNVGFCFSFPTEILPNGDGKIIAFNKEVRVDNAAGSILGEGINRVLKARGKTEKRFVVLNDTVAAMLGGLSENRNRYDGYIGYILGTGTNTCYLEKCENIIKNNDIRNDSGYMAVNMESGAYDGFAQGAFDLELDQESKDPGRQKMEKMISGAYQGALIHKTVRAAAAENLFSKRFCENFSALSGFDLAQIDAFCADPKGGNALAALAETSDDRETLFELIDASFERSARITTVNFAAILKHSGCGTDPSRPVRIVAEGSNFTKSVLFRPKLDAYVKSYIQSNLKRHCEIGTMKHATLLGTAVAAFTKQTF